MDTISLPWGPLYNGYDDLLQVAPSDYVDYGDEEEEEEWEEEEEGGEWSSREKVCLSDFVDGGYEEEEEEYEEEGGVGEVFIPASMIGVPSSTSSPPLLSSARITKEGKVVMTIPDPPIGAGR